MATYNITLNGQSKSLSTSDPAQIAAIAACRAAYNNALPDTAEVPRANHADYKGTDADYVGFVFGHWATANPGYTDQQLADAFASAAASYAGQDIPQPTPEEVTPEVRKAQLQAYAVDKRWRVEVGGITVNGIALPTNDRAKLLILGAAKNLADGATSPLILNGVVVATLNGVQFRALDAAVTAHVQATFVTLAAVLAAIEAEEIDDEADIDAADWPSN